MFTGIIEALGEVRGTPQGRLKRPFYHSLPPFGALKIDQSVAHNGVCLTVVDLGDGTHTVTAIDETLKRSSLGCLAPGSMVNLERAMQSDGRLDGHIVQGHVDTTGVCTSVEMLDGSWYFHFQYEPGSGYLLVDKGSVTIDGVSLTVVNPVDDLFSVAIIPYTFAHTTFGQLEAGMRVNLEFDVIGKYIARYAALYLHQTAG